MSYILTGKSNPAFNLMALIVAPMLQSTLLCKLKADRTVDVVVKYVGLRVERDHVEPADNDPAKATVAAGMDRDVHPGTHQQVAVFEIIESYNAELVNGPGDTLYIPLTEMTLEHCLFAFIPTVIPEAQDGEKLVQGVD